MKSIIIKKPHIVLFFLFVLALIVRFLYFPQNIYFGYDQARDAFESISIYKNFDLKIIGPSAAHEGLFHGPLYWYLIGPLYLLGAGNPAIPAGFLIFLNGIGIFVIYKLTDLLFDKKTALISSLLYAFSFEQTQYALYFGNPAPAVLTIMLFYLGLYFFIFKREWKGFALSLFSLGLSIQFEFFLIYLIPIFFVYLFIFRKRISLKLNWRKFFYLLLSLLLPVSTFILAELKYGFRTTRTLLSMFIDKEDGRPSFLKIIDALFKRLSLHFNDNILASNYSSILLVALLAYILFVIIKNKKGRDSYLFLLIWIFSSVLIYFFGIANLYYLSIGISTGVIIITSSIISKLFNNNVVIGVLTLLFICLSNFRLISLQNKNGIINSIYVQEGMLLGRLENVVDFVYKESENKPIVVGASTMPLNVNTTWAYLFNWYGLKKYGKLPYWSGDVALGYPGELPLWKSQEKSYSYFSIIEPERGVGWGHIDKFLEEQKQYGNVVMEKSIGDSPSSTLVVQKRKN